MPIDLLAPLVAIPIVVFFAFAGCVVPGAFSNVKLRWAGGLQTDIASIEVTFGLDPDSGEDPSNLHPPPAILSGPSLNDFFVNGLDVSDAAPWGTGSPGTLNCFCKITEVSTGKTLNLLASMSFEISEGSWVDPSFDLARFGTGFDQADFSLTSAS
jgi:hypothetical protein